jgi:hypothetical protein
MAFIAFLTLAVQDLPASPIIVRIIEPKKDPTGLGRLSEILVGSLGLTGALLLLAALLGVLLAGLTYWVRSRQS